MNRSNSSTDLYQERQRPRLLLLMPISRSNALLEATIITTTEEGRRPDEKYT